MKTKSLTFTVFLYEVLSVPVCLAIKNPLVADGGEEASVSNEVCQYTTAKPKLKKIS